MPINNIGQIKPNRLVNGEMLYLNIVRSNEDIQGMNRDKIDKQNDQEAYITFHAIIKEGIIFASLSKKVLNCLRSIIKCDNYIICIAIQRGCVKIAIP